MRQLIILLLLAGLTACASPLYGNYLKISDLYNEEIADDVAKELRLLYPPASTHFILSQDTKDAFGTELLKKLRESGFAIEQGHSTGTIFASSDKATQVSAPPTDPNAVKPPIAKAQVSVAAIPFGYIADKVTDNLFRVTIIIDSKAISRFYMGSGKGIVPAGAWTRRQ